MLWSSINTCKNHAEFLKSYPLDNVLSYLFLYPKSDRRSRVKGLQQFEVYLKKRNIIIATQSV